MSRIQPLYNKVLIKRESPKEQTTAGGLVLLPSQELPHSKGEVIAVGPGRMNNEGVLLPMTLKVGDVVLFMNGRGMPISIDGIVHLMFEEGELLGVWHEESEKNP
jgi:chaperonin GroES